MTKSSARIDSSCRLRISRSARLTKSVSAQTGICEVARIKTKTAPKKAGWALEYAGIVFIGKVISWSLLGKRSRKNIRGNDIAQHSIDIHFGEKLIIFIGFNNGLPSRIE